MARSNRKRMKVDLGLLPVRMEELKEGDIIIADNNFSCMPEGGEVEVFVCSECQSLCVSCTAKGGHHLNSEVGSDGNLEGFYKRRTA